MSGPVLWPGGQLAQSGCIDSTKLSYHLQWASVPKLTTEWSLHQAKSWAEKLSGGVLAAQSQNCARLCQVPVDTIRFLIDTLRLQCLGICPDTVLFASIDAVYGFWVNLYLVPLLLLCFVLGWLSFITVLVEELCLLPSQDVVLECLHLLCCSLN